MCKLSYFKKRNLGYRRDSDILYFAQSETAQLYKYCHVSLSSSRSCCLATSPPIGSSLHNYLALRGFLGDSKLEVPLSGVGSSSGKVSNSEPSLLAARALRGLIDKEKQLHIFYENKCHIWGARLVLCHN